MVLCYVFWVRCLQIGMTHCHFRACRGKLVTLIVRFPSQGRQVDDIEIWSHTNETIGKSLTSIAMQLLRVTFVTC